jgi:hypothetical protein
MGNSAILKINFSRDIWSRRYFFASRSHTWIRIPLESIHVKQWNLRWNFFFKTSIWICIRMEKMFNSKENKNKIQHSIWIDSNEITLIFFKFFKFFYLGNNYYLIKRHSNSFKWNAIQVGSLIFVIKFEYLT